MTAWWATVLLVAEVFGVLLAIDAIMRPRSAQGAIAWSVALVFMPTLTIPFYLVFGRTRFQGYSEALRDKEKDLDARIPDWYRAMNALRAELPHEVRHLGDVVHGLGNVPFTRGSHVELLIDADATYGAMRSSIASANAYVLVQFYIVRDDESSRALRDALIERARAGVRVCFLYDAIGSLNLSSDFLDAMRRESIEVASFRTSRGWRNRFQLNFRNHRKLLVVDGATGFIGGLNLGDEYLRFRDTHLVVRGPAVQQIQLTFAKDWYWATRRIIELQDRTPPELESTASVAIVTTGPADAIPKCSILFAELIGCAQTRVWLASPYFVPDDVMIRALQAAAKRGVDVRVIVPDQPDHRFVELASLTYHGELMDCGVRLFRYGPRFMHQKVILVDQSLAGVGTVNLDYRSLYLNFEETALVADSAFVGLVEQMLTEDLAHCDEVQRTYFEDQPFTVRALARVARLSSPLL